MTEDKVSNYASKQNVSLYDDGQSAVESLQLWNKVI